MYNSTLPRYDREWRKKTGRGEASQSGLQVLWKAGRIATDDESQERHLKGFFQKGLCRHPCRQAWCRRPKPVSPSEKHTKVDGTWYTLLRHARKRNAQRAERLTFLFLILASWFPCVTRAHSFLVHVLSSRRDSCPCGLIDCPRFLGGSNQRICDHLVIWCPKGPVRWDSTTRFSWDRFALGLRFTCGPKRHLGFPRSTVIYDCIIWTPCQASPSYLQSLCMEGCGRCSSVLVHLSLARTRSISDRTRDSPWIISAHRLMIGSSITWVRAYQIHVVVHARTKYLYCTVCTGTATCRHQARANHPTCGRAQGKPQDHDRRPNPRARWLVAVEQAVSSTDHMFFWLQW
jgi:hypothetical protein